MIKPHKKIVTFATLDEFNIEEPIDEQSYNERPVDVEPNNSKEIQTDLDQYDDIAIDTIAEVSEHEEDQSGGAQAEPQMMAEPLRKVSRKDSGRRSKYFKRSFFRNSFRKTLWKVGLVYSDLKINLNVFTYNCKFGPQFSD